MKARGIPHTLAREPGGTPVGEAIRGVVLDKGELTMPPETELFLILGARAAFVQEVVWPVLERGEVFLADRFSLSTFAYQGFGRGLDQEQVRRANELATGGLEPDLYLVLDVPVEEGLERKGDPGAGDRIEREGTPFLARVRNGYHLLAKEEPRALLIPASEDPETVQSAIRRVLSQRFPETFGGDEV
jgi:dTMP kinase